MTNADRPTPHETTNAGMTEVDDREIERASRIGSLIARAKRCYTDHPSTDGLTVELLDALEASQAQMADFEDALVERDEMIDAHMRLMHGDMDAKLSWPADLLEAVRHLGGDFPRKSTYNDGIQLRREAIATLTRYRLIADPSEGGQDG